MSVPLKSPVGFSSRRVLRYGETMTEDAQLLARFAKKGDETAFRELVSRHFDLVYSAALRQLNGDTHLAEDVAQMVFTDLARKAGVLPRGIVLAGCFTKLPGAPRRTRSAANGSDASGRMRPSACMNPYLNQQPTGKKSLRSSTRRWANWARRTGMPSCCIISKAKASARSGPYSASAMTPRKRLGQGRRVLKQVPFDIRGVVQLQGTLWIGSGYPLPERSVGS